MDSGAAILPNFPWWDRQSGFVAGSLDNTASASDVDYFSVVVQAQRQITETFTERISGHIRDQDAFAPVGGGPAAPGRGADGLLFNRLGEIPRQLRSGPQPKGTAIRCLGTRQRRAIWRVIWVLRIRAQVFGMPTIQALHSR